MLPPQARPARRSRRLRSTLLLAGAAVGAGCLTIGVVSPASATAVSPVAVVTPVSSSVDAPTPEQLAEAQRQARSWMGTTSQRYAA